MEHGEASDVPLDVHTDDHHHEVPGLGCGYGDKVENAPEKVGAPESVSASDRYERARASGGRVLHYTGGHKPVSAVINRRVGKTLNQKALWDEGRGTFVLDLWVVEEYAKRLGVPAEPLIAHIESTFRKTVAELAGITDVVEFS